MKKQIFFVGLLMFSVSVFVVSGIIFNDRIIGRALDFPVPPVDYLVKNNYLINFCTWWGTMNGGIRNSFGAALIPVNSVLYFPLIFGAGSWIISRYQIVLTLFFAMFFFYILSKRLIEGYKLEEKYKIALSIIGGLFFTLNGYFFCDITFGSNAQYFSFSLTPLLIYSFISYLKYKKEIYFLLSLITIIIISSTFQHLVLAYIMFFVISIVYKNFKFLIKVGLLHFLLSLYWILPLIGAMSEVAKVEMVFGINRINLLLSSEYFIDSIILKEYFFSRNIYNTALNNDFLSHIWVTNAFILLIVSLLILAKLKFVKKIHKRLILGFFIIFILSLLFIKGGHRPFGNVIIYLYEHFSIFSLFRSLQHYLGFYTLSISIIFVFSGLFLLNKNKRFLLLLFGLVFINAMPWWYTRDFGVKNITSTDSVSSYFGHFHLTEGNKKMYALNNLPLDFSIFHVPPGFSVSFLAVGENRLNFFTDYSGNEIKSQGTDAGLFFGNKKYFATDAPKSDLSNVLVNMENEAYLDTDFLEKNKNLLYLLGVRYLTIREDVAPIRSESFKIFNLKNIKEAVKESSLISSLETEDFITIAKMKDFLPHFYAPQRAVISERETEELSRILSQDNFSKRPAVFFKNQNIDKEKTLAKIAKDSSNVPILEFRKLNPTKYRIRVHGASENFPLIFSENFHNEWKIYLNPLKEIKSNLNDKISAYKILEGSEEDQASKSELKNYIKKGWITALGDGKEKNIKHIKDEKGAGKAGYTEKYSINFISKNFHGTIQNDNLPEGNAFETLFKKPVSDNQNHLEANGYANSWLIDIDQMCSQNNKCVRNSDGSYDFELVAEFRFQKLFSIGLLVSGVVLLAYLGYLGYNWKKRKAICKE